MLVDDDPKAVEKLSKVLTEAAGWQFRTAGTGGEALDVVSQERPQIVMVKEDLPDLPGSMVVHTVKSSSPDAVTLLYTPPGRSGRPGEVKLVDTSGTMNTIASYAEPGQLAAPLGEIREALRAKAKERRYLQAFRQRHFEFLQRYNNIKQPPQGRARPPQEEDVRLTRAQDPHRENGIELTVPLKVHARFLGSSVQQSATVEQTSPKPEQHLPLRHARPQQSASSRQLPPVTTQHSVDSTDGMNWHDVG